MSELRDMRNKWAHQEPFSSDDADRALDSAERLLAAVSAPQADEIRKVKMELRRTVFDEQVRSDRRRSAGTAIESAAAGNLKPWREMVTPHRDVATGRYQQAEFAADLWRCPGRGDTSTAPGGVLPPHLPHRGFAPLAASSAMRRLRAGGRSGRRSFRRTSAAARRTRCWRSTTCAPGRPPASCGLDGDACGRRGSAHCLRQARGARRATRSRPGTRCKRPMAPRCARCGASSRGSSVAEGFRAACRR